MAIVAIAVRVVVVVLVWVWEGTGPRQRRLGGAEQILARFVHQVSCSIQRRPLFGLDHVCTGFECAQQREEVDAF